MSRRHEELEECGRCWAPRSTTSSSPRSPMTNPDDHGVDLLLRDALRDLVPPDPERLVAGGVARGRPVELEHPVRARRARGDGPGHPRRRHGPVPRRGVGRCRTPGRSDGRRSRLPGGPLPVERHPPERGGRPGPGHRRGHVRGCRARHGLHAAPGRVHAPGVGRDRPGGRRRRGRTRGVAVPSDGWEVFAISYTAADGKDAPVLAPEPPFTHAQLEQVVSSAEWFGEA